MKKITDNQYYWMPILLLVVCVGTYGVYLSQLGFYWDDWLVINQTSENKIASEMLWFYDRPISAWLEVTGRAVFGTNPLYWHIAKLILRWLSVWSMWEVVKRIWPKQVEQTAWMSILFSVYPIFFQQSTAILFLPHWVAFTLYFLSLTAMIHSYQNEKYYWPLTFIGMLTAAGHLFTIEYIAGLELARPVIIWFILTPQIYDCKAKIRTTIRYWLPYLFIYITFIGYRIVFFPGEVEPNPLVSFTNSRGIAANIVDLIGISLKDVYHVLVTSWSDIIQPNEIFIDSPGDLRAWVIAISISVLVYFTFRFINTNRSDEKNYRWERPAILFGIFLVLVGFIPVWGTGNTILMGKWSDRFGIPALFGASVFIVAFFSLLIYRRNYWLIAVSVLLGIAINTQIRIANDFRWEWKRQLEGYWQIYWRAPSIEPNTPIIAEGAFTSYSNRWNAAFAINLLYPQVEGSDSQAYWYFEIPYNHLYYFIDEILEGESLIGQYKSEKPFLGDSRNSIMIYTQNSKNQCLWFLTPRDIHNNGIPVEMREMIPLINLDRIHPEPASDKYPAEETFGPEPKHGWCYYFQKASLYRQLENWEKITFLWEEASQNNYHPSNSYEFIPFIEAFIFREEWEQAIKLSKNARLMSRVKIPMVCASWDNMRESFVGNEEFDLAYQKATQILKCPNR